MSSCIERRWLPGLSPYPEKKKTSCSPLLSCALDMRALNPAGMPNECCDVHLGALLLAHSEKRSVLTFEEVCLLAQPKTPALTQRSDEL